MSYPASVTTFPSFPPLSRRAAVRRPAAPALPAASAPSFASAQALPALPALPAFSGLPRKAPAHPAQLLEWLRLAARQVFGSELAARVEPYRACRCCVSQVRWCGEGEPAHPLASLASLASAAMGAMETSVRLASQHTQDSLAPLAQLSPDVLDGITPLTPSLVLGAKADPYPLAEAELRRTRNLLERLASAPSVGRSLEISIFTRSPLLLRDLDLLVELDQRHAVTVSVLIPAAEPGLARRLEAGIRTAPAPARAAAPQQAPLLPFTAASPARADRFSSRRAPLDPATPARLAPMVPLPPMSPMPRMSRMSQAPPPPASPVSNASPASPAARFELVRTLAAHGIATEVLCTPIHPGLNNGVAVLRQLFDLAYQAGAFDVRPAPRHPAMPPSSGESRQLLALFRRLRLERGFPRILPGRG